MTETGLAGAEVEAWSALFAPKGTPRDIVEQLFAAIWGAIETPAIRRRFEELGAVIPSKDAAARKRCARMSPPRCANGCR